MKSERRTKRGRNASPRNHAGFMNGFIAYHGPGSIDGAPIVVIVTGLARPSDNGKTGPMLQTWIIRSDIEPTEAVKVGDDASICGSCPHRGTSCYVLVHNAPLSVYRAFSRGAYPDLSAHPAAQAELVRGRKLRIGSYGDPAAAPRAVWEPLVAAAAGHTGYTHADASLGDLLMISVDSAEQASDAAELGFRTFRVLGPDDTLGPNEVECPASDEARARRAPGKPPVTCETCGLCDGTRPNDRRKSVAIRVHGSRASRLRVVD